MLENLQYMIRLTEESYDSEYCKIREVFYSIALWKKTAQVTLFV